MAGVGDVGRVLQEDHPIVSVKATLAHPCAAAPRSSPDRRRRQGCQSCRAWECPSSRQPAGEVAAGGAEGEHRRARQEVVEQLLFDGIDTESARPTVGGEHDRVTLAAARTDPADPRAACTLEGTRRIGPARHPGVSTDGWKGARRPVHIFSVRSPWRDGKRRWSLRSRIKHVAWRSVASKVSAPEGSRPHAGTSRRRRPTRREGRSVELCGQLVGQGVFEARASSALGAVRAAPRRTRQRRSDLGARPIGLAGGVAAVRKPHTTRGARRGQLTPRRRAQCEVVADAAGDRPHEVGADGGALRLAHDGARPRSGQTSPTEVGEARLHPRVCIAGSAQPHAGHLVTFAQHVTRRDSGGTPSVRSMMAVAVAIYAEALLGLEQEVVDSVGPVQRSRRKAFGQRHVLVQPGLDHDHRVVRGACRTSELLCEGSRASRGRVRHVDELRRRPEQRQVALHASIPLQWRRIAATRPCPAGSSTSARGRRRRVAPTRAPPTTLAPLGWQRTRCSEVHLGVEGLDELIAGPRAHVTDCRLDAVDRYLVFTGLGLDHADPPVELGEGLATPEVGVWHAYPQHHLITRVRHARRCPSTD